MVTKWSRDRPPERWSTVLGRAAGRHRASRRWVLLALGPRHRMCKRLEPRARFLACLCGFWRSRPADGANLVPSPLRPTGAPVSAILATPRVAKPSVFEIRWSTLIRKYYDLAGHVYSS